MNTRSSTEGLGGTRTRPSSTPELGVLAEAKTNMPPKSQVKRSKSWEKLGTSQQYVRELQLDPELSNKLAMAAGRKRTLRMGREQQEIQAGIENQPHLMNRSHKECIDKLVKEKKAAQKSSQGGERKRAAMPADPPVKRARAACDPVPSCSGIGQSAKYRQFALRSYTPQELAGIIGVVHVPEKSVPNEAGDARPAPDPELKTTILNDCIFVDMSQSEPSASGTVSIETSLPADIADVLHDHDYCSSYAPPPRTAAPTEGDAPAPPLGHRPARSSLWTLENIYEDDESDAPVGAEHGATIDQCFGNVVDCYYGDYQLIVAQDLRISFFQQSGLGMFLESHRMWIPRGRLTRLPFDDNYVRKLSRHNVVHSAEMGLAYLELYCKEHNHDSRKLPGCDLFVVLYYRNKADSEPKCKLHQLDKFTGYAKNVQFVVAQKINCVTVYYESWVGTTSTPIMRQNVTTYSFSDDLQSVASVSEHQTPPHPITSLFLVEDCDRMVVGCAGSETTFWNAQYLVRTIKMPPDAVNTSFRCDRGFIFVLQQLHKEMVLRLIAINVGNFAFKSLRLFRPPTAFVRLQRAIMHEGDVIAFFQEGRVCWSMDTGRVICSVPVQQSLPPLQTSWPHGEWLISVWRDRIFVRRIWKLVRQRAASLDSSD